MSPLCSQTVTGTKAHLLDPWEQFKRNLNNNTLVCIKENIFRQCRLHNVDRFALLSIRSLRCEGKHQPSIHPDYAFNVAKHEHYSDFIMSAMTSQITSLTIVYSTVYSDADQRKHQSPASLTFFAGNSPMTGEFPAQMASNAEIVSIWWRHHDECLISQMCSVVLNDLTSIQKQAKNWISYTNDFQELICSTVCYTLS